MSMDTRALQIPDIGLPLLRNPLGQRRFHMFWVHMSTHSAAVLTHICYCFPRLGYETMLRYIKQCLPPHRYIFPKQLFTINSAILPYVPCSSPG